MNPRHLAPVPARRDGVGGRLDALGLAGGTNALRQRPVLLEKMGNVKQYLEGEFQVKQDATANLPAEIQKEILGSMQDPSPQGWEELNRNYFERLSNGNVEAENK
jgi:hypothetical protein